MTATEITSTTLESLLARATRAKASDLHLQAGEAPWIRRHGEIEPLAGEARFTDESVAKILETLRPGLGAANELDFAHEDATGGRYRVAAFRTHAGRALAFRVLGAAPPSLDALGLPRDLLRVIHARGGVVLFAGHAGAGKTTTLASVLQELCRRRSARLVTLEDPVEYKLERGIAYVEQREAGRHWTTFGQGIRDVLEDAPDAIAVGELRDLDTIRAALHAAETGTLLFATVHAPDVTRAIGRIVDAFPADERPQARLALAGTLRMAVAQTLLRRGDNRGRVPAVEVIHGSPPIAALIRDGKEHEIATIVESTRRRGMRLLDDSIVELVRKGLVDRDEAIFFAVNRESTARRLES
jgi:twitching motility protein PilT